MMALATASCAPAKLLMQKSQTRRRGLKLWRVGRVCSANSVEGSVASSEACLILGLGRGPQVLDSKKSPKFLLGVPPLVCGKTTFAFVRVRPSARTARLLTSALLPTGCTRHEGSRDHW